MWHWTIYNEQWGGQALWRHHCTDGSHGHRQTGIMFRACASHCLFEFFWKMGTTQNGTYKQWSPADWWHRTILEEDDGGGPRLPHWESVPPRERNCKLDLYEPQLTLTYPHMHLSSLNSMGEPTQTRSRGRRCLSWRKDQRRWKFPIGEWEKDNKISSKLWYSLQQNI